MTNMYFYTAYGLTIQAALPLPELVPVQEVPPDPQGAVDVVIRFGCVAGSGNGPNGAGERVHAAAEGIYLTWPDVGTFLVRGGREVVVDPLRGVEERVLRLFILGTTLAMLLHQRGEAVVLHASAAAVGDQAVAFVGAKGAGKSTLAAALQAGGHRLVADDIVAVTQGPAGPSVLPGFPHIKLWPDSAASLGLGPDTLPRLRPELDKRGHRVSAGFAHAPVPLSCVCVLGQGAEPEMERLSPRQALAVLMAHWYGARFGMELLQALGTGHHLVQCAGLANQIAVYRLNRPACLAALPAVVRMVEMHVGSHGR